MLEIPLPFADIHLYALDLLAAFSLLWSLANYHKIKQTPLFKPLIYFAITLLFTWLIKAPASSADRLILGFLYLLRLISYLSLYFTFTLHQSISTTTVIRLGLAIFTLLGLLQYAFLPDTRFLKPLGFDDHYFRLLSTFLDPNFAGAALSVAVITALTTLTGSLRLLSIVPLLALAFTFSRSSFLSFSLAALLLLIKKFKKEYLLIIPILLIFIILAPKPFGAGVNLTRTFSIQARWDTLSQHLPTLRRHPLVGIGYNNLQNHATSIYPNRAGSSLPNSYFHILLTTGALGLSLFLNFIFKAFQNLSSWGQKTALLTLLIHALFNNTLLYNWTLVLLLLIISQPQRE